MRHTGTCTGNDQLVCNLEVSVKPWRAGMPSVCQLMMFFAGGKVGLRVFHPLAACSCL